MTQEERITQLEKKVAALEEQQSGENFYRRWIILWHTVMHDPHYPLKIPTEKELSEEFNHYFPNGL